LQPKHSFATFYSSLSGFAGRQNNQLYNGAIVPSLRRHSWWRGHEYLLKNGCYLMITAVSLYGSQSLMASFFLLSFLQRLR
jgi:hypothetical protein